MFLTIDTNDPRPIYQQVADGIKELIARGKLAEGASLPPVRQLAVDLGVNLNTIATAYRELQKDGLIGIRHGSGSVVVSRTTTQRGQDELLRPLRTAANGVSASWSVVEQDSEHGGAGAEHGGKGKQVDAHRPVCRSLRHCVLAGPVFVLGSPQRRLENVPSPFASSVCVGTESR